MRVACTCTYTCTCFYTCTIFCIRTLCWSQQKHFTVLMTILFFTVYYCRCTVLYPSIIVFSCLKWSIGSGISNSTWTRGKYYSWWYVMWWYTTSWVWRITLISNGIYVCNGTTLHVHVHVVMSIKSHHNYIYMYGTEA